MDTKEMKGQALTSEEMRQRTAAATFRAALPETTGHASGARPTAESANDTAIGDGAKYSLSIAEKAFVKECEKVRDAFAVSLVFGRPSAREDAQNIIFEAFWSERAKVRTMLGVKNARTFGRTFLSLKKSYTFPTIETARTARLQIVEDAKAERLAKEIDAKRAKIQALADVLGISFEATEAAIKAGFAKV